LSAIFPGIVSDPRTSVINQVPGSATEQVNACSINQGELRVRSGLREVTFEDE
jgi:hypothetical protein